MMSARKIAAVGMSIAVLTGCDATQAPPETQTTSSVEAPGPAPPAASPDSGFADVVERLAPSVMTVRIPNGVGSGVVLQPDVIVTNAHVVGTAREVVLVFADGEEAGGTVIASDEVTDVAVVRSQRGGLPVPEYRPELPRPGEIAIAIGSPLGFQNSVTAGVISGLHRDIPGSASQSSSLVDLIQTDAPISPGNSGGALLDAQGRVVGINEAYISPEIGAVSLAFAIPTSTVLDITRQLLETGRAVHPYLGVSVGQLTPAIQRSLGVESDRGALVTAVDPGSPAAAAGLRPGDVIVDLAGESVQNVEDLLRILRGTRVGQQVPVDVVRAGDRQTVTVTVSERTR